MKRIVKNANVSLRKEVGLAGKVWSKCKMFGFPPSNTQVMVDPVAGGVPDSTLPKFCE